MVFLKLHAVRADGVLVGPALLHAVPQVEAEVCFLAHTVEVVEDAQPLCCVQLLAAGIQLGKAAGDVIGDTVKEGAGFFDILLVGGHGDVPLLHHTAHGVCDLAREHGVILSPIAVQKVVPVWEEDGFLKILAVDPLVVDGDLGRGAGVQRIEQFGIVQEHRRLILFGGDGVVDV